LPQGLLSTHCRLYAQTESQQARDLGIPEGAERVPEHGNPSVRRRRLAAELRRLRERAGFTGEQVAERLGWSGSKVSRIETSKLGVKEQDLRLLLQLYRVDEPRRSEVLALAREPAKPASVDSAAIAAYPAGYAELAYAEAEATSLWSWESQVVPGLLQTESYAREVMRGWFEMFNLPPAELEARVAARMRRQQLLIRDQPPPPSFSAIIDESVIRRRFGDNAVMRQQLERLAESPGLPNVEVRVLPLVGSHPIGAGPFLHMQFPQQYDVPFHDIVTVEQLDREILIEDVADTNKYRVTFESLRAEALEPDESRSLIARITEEIWS
jgi:transcriptional regulator with XRE-family HTH domain